FEISRVLPKVWEFRRLQTIELVEEFKMQRSSRGDLRIVGVEGQLCSHGRNRADSTHHQQQGQLQQMRHEKPTTIVACPEKECEYKVKSADLKTHVTESSSALDCGRNTHCPRRDVWHRASGESNRPPNPETCLAFRCEPVSGSRFRRRTP